MAGERKDFASSPMQERHDRIVRDLITKINSGDPKPTYDTDLFNKYHIYKYILANTENKPTEVWIYTEDSVRSPVVEDQALKRGELAYHAAVTLFTREAEESKLDQTQIALRLRQLENIFSSYQSEIKKIYQQKERDFKSDIEKLKQLFKDLINDITFDITNFWKIVNPKKEINFEEFADRLWHEIEIADPPFKRSNILSINLHPNVKLMQYYERGTQPLDESKELQYISAHDRKQEGIPNFIAYSTGHIDSGLDGKITPPEITHSGFRHASLNPIDLYKDEKQGTHAKCVSITHTNMMALMQNEMLGRVKPAEKAEVKAPSLTWLNVSLLTVNSDDQQDRQFRETILAGDIIRYSQQGLQPILFDFGVNFWGTGVKPTYPSEQKFENIRAFSQLQSVFFQTLNTAYESIKNETSNRKIFIEGILNDCKELEKMCNDFNKKINDSLEKFALECNTALNNYKNDQSEENLKAFEKASLILNQEKIKLYKEADTFFLNYKILFEKLKFPISQAVTHLENIRKGAIKSESTSLDGEIGTGALGYLLEHNIAIHDLFLTNQWQSRDHVFQLQAHLIQFGNSLDEVDQHFNGKSHPTAVSWNCKSGNDRSSVLDNYVTELTADRRAKEAILHDQKPIEFDRKANHAGSAASLAPIFDTVGPPKFGGRVVVAGTSITDPGHVDTEFAKMEEETSSWALHKSIKKFTGDNAPKPTGYKLISESSTRRMTTIFNSELLKDPKQQAFKQMLEQTKDLLSISGDVKNDAVNPNKRFYESLETFSTLLLRSDLNSGPILLFEKLMNDYATLSSDNRGKVKPVLGQFIEFYNIQGVHEVKSPSHDNELKLTFSIDQPEFKKQLASFHTERDLSKKFNSLNTTIKEINKWLKKNSSSPNFQAISTLKNDALNVRDQLIKQLIKTESGFRQVMKFGRKVLAKDSTETREIFSTYKEFLEAKSESDKLKLINTVRAAIFSWKNPGKPNPFLGNISPTGGSKKKKVKMVGRKDLRVEALDALESHLVQQSTLLENATQIKRQESLIAAFKANRNDEILKITSSAASRTLQVRDQASPSVGAGAGAGATQSPGTLNSPFPIFATPVVGAGPGPDRNLGARPAPAPNGSAGQRRNS